MKIAIAGYGVEGQSSYTYWQRTPMADITIVDESEIPSTMLPEGAKTLFGPGVFEKLGGFDLVVRSAGIAPHKIKTDGKIWSATNEFFLQCANEHAKAGKIDIIGVTGSKGKGTTASLIASILEAAGHKVWLVGNIGLAALDILDQIEPGDIVVYELSSFQLWDIERSPQTAVILFIEQEHLDVHKDMAEYVAAKANITKFQTSDDILIYNAENEYAQSIAADSIAQQVGYPSELTTHIKDGYFYNGEQKMCSVDVLQIPGEHNQSNAIAAIDAIWKYTQDTTAVQEGLHAFKGLPHRLAFTRTVNGVEYYDDSIATTPASAIAAIAAFPQPKVIILGGSDKGADYQPLLAAIKNSSSIRAIISIGANGTHITENLDDAHQSLVHRLETSTMVEIVTFATSLAQPGDAVILSPAAASFDMFKNYADRGQQFVAAVNNLS